MTEYDPAEAGKPVAEPNGRRMEKSGSGRWDGDRIEALAQRASDAFGAVLGLVTLTYVLTYVLPDGSWSKVVMIATATATSILALSASHVRGAWIHRAVALSILAMAIGVGAAVSGESDLLIVAWVIEVGLLAVSMGTVLATVVTSAKIGPRTIMGALTVYASLGILFTAVYNVIDRFQDTPFFSGVSDPAATDFLFFSYTTLTTTGYGNLVPAEQVGQMFAGLEMMIGQIFLVTLVAGLVSAWKPGEAVRRRREKRTGDGAAADEAAR